MPDLLGLKDLMKEVEKLLPEAQVAFFNRLDLSVEHAAAVFDGLLKEHEARIAAMISGTRVTVPTE